MGMMEYYSFERVLKELQMEEDELKRLVSEGEIRAFRDEDKMKFKRSDIDGLKKGRMTEPTIILPQGEPDDSSEDSEVLLVEEETSETLLDINELDDASSTAVPTVDFSDSSELDDSDDAETITEELNFEDESSSYVLESTDEVLSDSSDEILPVIDDEPSSETFLDSDSGMQTEPIEEIESADEDYGDLTEPTFDDHQDTEIADDEPELHSGHTKIAAPIILEEEPISGGLVGMLIAATVLLVFSGAMMINIIKGNDTPLTGWFTDIMFKTMESKYVKEKKVNIDSHMKWREEKRDKLEVKKRRRRRR